MRPKRVLLIECNEDGTIGGSHQALFDLVRSLDKARYEPVVLFYQSNIYEEKLRALGIEVHSFEEVRKRELRIRNLGHPIRKRSI